MIVKELITKLSYYDENDEVIISDITNGWGNQINGVFKDEQVCIEVGQLC